ncbi:MAG: tRNA lysidine(34) synthetase TilS, partial [Chloroflexi bacterium]|nr:tRNA lysidine(34) synthetase TilS [Chloroflexota bacterium]
MKPPSGSKTVKAVHRRVRESLRRSGLADGKTLVVAVSGGPDSLALLHSLHNLRDELGLRLHGAHLDHGLRGEASKADACFVAEVFGSLGIPYTIGRADVYALQKRRRLTLEEAAREARYAFLARVAAEQNADAAATGHTSDDQAETVLLNILRGAGLTGLRGMEAVARRVFDGREITLARPLLNVSRKETEAYCRALGLSPRLDESNLSPEMKRNRVRLELLPVLEQYNLSIRDALLRLSRSAAQDILYIEAEVDRVWASVTREGRGSVSLNRNSFKKLPPAIQSHLLRRAVSEVKGSLQDIEQSHIDDMARLIAARAGKSLDLPGGARFEVGYTEAVISLPGQTSCPLPQLEGEYRLNIPGETSIPGWRVAARILPANQTGLASPRKADEYTEKFDLDVVGEELWVRARKPGDRFQPLGMSGTKKLQDFMVDERIPRAWRDRVPLVVSPKG